MCRSRIILYTTIHSSYHTMTHNKVTWACCLRPNHGIHLARYLRPVASSPLLVLNWILNRGTRHYPRKRGAIPAEVAFLATIVASLEAYKLRADTPQVQSSTLVALNLTRLGRKPSRPLRLGVRPSIRFPSLFMPMPGPRWSSYSLLLWVLSFHLYLHLLHDPNLLN